MKLTGKHKGHVVVAEQTADGKLRVKSWTTPEDKPGPKKGIVGAEFATTTAAGRAVFAAMNREYGYPENLKGRFMVFRPEATTAPKRRRAATVAAEKATKAAKGPRAAKGPAPVAAKQEER